MRNLTFKTTLSISFIVFFSIIPVFGQVRINPFQVTTSTLFEDLLKFKAENPKIAPQALSEKANELLQQKALNFIFAFDASTCQKILEAKGKQKDKTQPVNLNATLKSVDAEIANIRLPDISFDKSECGRCFVKMPLFEFSGANFITSIQGRNIKFHTPSNFFFNEIALVDENNSLKEIRKWRVPFRTVPDGISDDGKLLYLELPFAELNELTLIIYDEGSFQFYPKSDLDLSAKSAELKEIPKEAVSPNTAFIKFVKGGKIQVLKYNTSCQ